MIPCLNTEEKSNENNVIFLYTCYASTGVLAYITKYLLIDINARQYAFDCRSVHMYIITLASSVTSYLITGSRPK